MESLTTALGRYRLSYNAHFIVCYWRIPAYHTKFRNVRFSNRAVMSSSLECKHPIRSRLGVGHASLRSPG